jgi:hypothetical protein
MVWDFVAGMSIDRNIQDLMMFREFAKQTAEFRPFGGIQASEEVLVVPIGDLRQLRKNASAHARQGKQLDTIVLGLDSACDPTLRLELVHDLGDRSASHCQGFSQLSRSCWLSLVEMAEQDPLGNRGLPRVQGPGKVPRDSVGNTPQPIAQVAFKVGDGGSGGRYSFHRNNYDFRGNYLSSSFWVPSGDFSSGRFKRGERRAVACLVESVDENSGK